MRSKGGVLRGRPEGGFEITRQHRTSRAQDLRAVGRSFAFPANREIRVRATAAERRERDVSKSRAGAVANRAQTRRAKRRRAQPRRSRETRRIKYGWRVGTPKKDAAPAWSPARARRRARDREKHTRRDATRRTSRRLGDPKIPVVSKGGRWTCVWRVTTEPRRRGGKRKRKRAAERGWFVLGCLVTVWFVCHEIFDVRYWSVCYSKKIGGPSVKPPVPSVNSSRHRLMAHGRRAVSRFGNACVVRIDPD